MNRLLTMIAILTASFLELTPANALARIIRTGQPMALSMTNGYEKHRGCEMIRSIRSEAGGLEPGVRAYVLDRLAMDLRKCDPMKARPALVAGFRATLEIPYDQEDTKIELQSTILEHLLNLQGAHIGVWLAQAESAAQNRTRTIMLSRLTTAGKLDRALAVLRSFPADKFPYAEAANLILAFPPGKGDSAALEVLGLAVASYSQNDDSCLGCYDLARMIVHCWHRIPAALTLEAINDVLEAADKTPDSADVVYGVQFANEHEYRVFELMPVIIQLDKRKADSLFEIYPDLRAKLQPSGPSTQSNLLDFDHSAVSGPRRPQSAERGLASRISEITYDDRVLKIEKLAERDPHQALAAAVNLPLIFERTGHAPESQTTNPRAEALLAIAYASAINNPSVDKDALDEMLKSLDVVDASKGLDFCIRAARLAKRLGDVDLGQRSLDEGMRNYRALYAADTNAEDPNIALKAWWPSVVGLSQLMIGAHEMGHDQLVQREMLDPEVRLLVKVRLASEMIGVREGLVIQVSKKNSHKNYTTRFAEYAGQPNR